MFFEAPDKNGNYDLWVTDGTAANTVAIGGLGDIGVAGAGPGLGPTDMMAFGQKMLFVGTDAEPGANANSLWLTDGTVDGTTEIGGVSPGSGHTSPFTNGDPQGLSPTDITVFGAKALFKGLDTSGNYYLWVTDGTVGGTTEIGGLANVGIAGKSSGAFSSSGFAAYGTLVLFDANDSDGYRGLWETDGTATGTFEIGGVDNAGIQDSGVSSFLTNDFVTLGTKELFAADNADGDDALWITDGTATGTVEIGGVDNSAVVGANDADLASGFAEQVRFGNRIFFAGGDTASGTGLWGTDGTVQGTREIGGLDDAGLSHAGAQGLHPADLTVMGQQLLFNGLDSLSVNELWASDGTAIGTTEIGGLADQLLQDVAIDGLNPTNITALGRNKAVFIGQDDSNGTNAGKATLWVTDGTTAGTQEIGGLDNQSIANVYSMGLNLTSLTGADSVAYFMGQDANGVSRLWQTDGTAGGTRVVTDAAGNAPATGISAFGLTAGPVPTTDLPQSPLPQDLTAVAFSQALDSIFNETTGVLSIVDTANSFATVASIVVGTTALVGSIVKLANDGGGGTNVSLVTSNGTIDGPTSGNTVDLTGLAYAATDETVLTARSSGGTLRIVDTARGNAVVAVYALDGSDNGGVLTLAKDAGSGTLLGFTPTPSLGLAPGRTVTANIPGGAPLAIVDQYNNNNSLYLEHRIFKLANGNFDYHFAGGTYFTGQAFTAYDNVYTPAGVSVSQTIDNGNTPIQTTTYNSDGTIYLRATVKKLANGNLDYHYASGSFFTGKPFTAYDNVLTAAGVRLSQTIFNGTTPTQTTTYNSDGTVLLHATVQKLANGNLDYHYASGSYFTGKPFTAYDTIYTTAGVAVSQTVYNGTTPTQTTTYNSDGTVYVHATVVKQSSGNLDYHYVSGSFFTGKAFTAYDNVYTAGGVPLTQTFYTGTTPIRLTTYNSNGTVYQSDAISYPASGQILNHVSSGSFFTGKAYSAFDNLTNASATTLEQELYNNDGSHTFTVPGSGLTLLAAHADTFTVTGGSDTIRFGASGFGADTFSGFKAGDTVSFSTSIFASYAAMTPHVSGTSSAVITDTHGDTLTLAGVAASSLTSAMFKYV